MNAEEKKSRLKGKAVHRISAGYIRSSWRLTDGTILMTCSVLPLEPSFEDLVSIKKLNENNLKTQAEQLFSKKGDPHGSRHK